MEKVRHEFGVLNYLVYDNRLSLINQYLIISGAGDYEATVIDEYNERVKVIGHNFDGWFSTDKLLSDLKEAHGNSMETTQVLNETKVLNEN